MYHLFLRFLLFLVCLKWGFTQLCGNCTSENIGRCTIDEQASYKCLGSEFLDSAFYLKLKRGVQFHRELKNSKVPHYDSDMSACFIDGFKFNPNQNFSVCCVYSRQKGWHLVVAKNLEKFIPCGLCRMPEFPNNPGGICPCKELHPVSPSSRSSSDKTPCRMNAFTFGIYVTTVLKIIYLGI